MSAYSNLLSHLNGKHPGFMAEYEDSLRQAPNTLSNFGFVDEKTGELFQWMRWVVERNHPLCEVDNPLTRAMSKLQPISSKILKLHMQHVTTKVGASITRAMGDQFGRPVRRVDPNNFAELSLHTHLRPVKANATRWPSAYGMLERYIVIRDAAKRVTLVENLVPRSSAHNKIVTLFQRLAEINSVCKTLRSEDRTMTDVRLFFDSVVEKYPVMGNYLRPQARIVHSSVFKSAAVKVINDSLLSVNEAKSVRAFVDLSPGTAQNEYDGDDFATSVMRAAKKSRLSQRSAIFSIMHRTECTLSHL